MQLTSYTDYVLRVLLYLAMSPEQQAKITEIADFFNISRNHLIKVVHQLGSKSFVKTTRGKGGLSLPRPSEMIRIGEVVRSMENHFNRVECFGPARQHCRLRPGCGLKHVLTRAGNAYFQILDNATLADVLLETAPITEQTIGNTSRALPLSFGTQARWQQRLSQTHKHRI
jgi:Rrf2 family nitric oxide-sensitive transcriptional repressor